jgi:S-adenosyl-L-methionine hydrolase (adenosine-forming)
LISRIVTLTSDFGLRDPYVAEMKAVILSICPEATIVDITHEIEKFNVRAGAVALASAASYFPKGTVHVAVVDPGVGTRRRPILVQTGQGVFVGPDNGVLIPAADKEEITHIYEITNTELMLSHVSNTFHGRDIFAPIAAHLSNGISPTDCGPEIDDAVKPEFTKFTSTKETLIGEILYVDDFGNVITNVREPEAREFNDGDWLTVELPNRDLRLRFAKTYAEAKPKEPIALIGSHGYVEIALNQGSANKEFHIRIGDRFKLIRNKKD